MRQMDACTLGFNTSLQCLFCMGQPQFCNGRRSHRRLFKGICQVPWPLPQILLGKVTVQLTVFIAVSYLWKARIITKQLNTNP